VAQGGTTWRTNYYTVTGATLQEIRESIQRARPWRDRHDHVAVTDWNIRARSTVVPFQGEFRCSGFNTLTIIRITMPRWTPPEGVADQVKAEWERYESALLAHEVGHGHFALAAAAEMHRRVRALGNGPDAEGLRQQAQQTVAQVMEEFQRREQEYDRLTRHGAEQGASFRHERWEHVGPDHPAAPSERERSDRDFRPPRSHQWPRSPT
jgi:predicted secreted Zn-dependent protease